MAEYSIKDLENFTNIKAHTLRIWEQRYKLLEPRRTTTNIRYYSDNDLRKILNINLLYSRGYKISRIAKMTEQEILQLAAEILEVRDTQPAGHVDYFIRYLVEMNESRIEEKLSELYADMGLEQMYAEVMIPLLQKIGDLWQINTISVSHEHFFSNILRDFFIMKTATLPALPKPKGKVILFLHEREMHELSLLYYNYVLKSRGYTCYYLGQNVPIRDLQLMVDRMKPDYLFTSIIAETDRAFFADFIEQLCHFFKPEAIYMGGSQLQKYLDLLPGAIHQVNSLKDIDLY